jgi:hypothetical protein
MKPTRTHQQCGPLRWSPFSRLVSTCRSRTTSVAPLLRSHATTSAPSLSILQSQNDGEEKDLGLGFSQEVIFFWLQQSDIVHHISRAQIE